MDSGTIEQMLASQGIQLAAGRAQRMAPGVNTLNGEDPLRAALAFEVDPTTYVLKRDQR